jgi:hypothetical protein
MPASGAIPATCSRARPFPPGPPASSNRVCRRAFSVRGLGQGSESRAAGSDADHRVKTMSIDDDLDVQATAIWYLLPEQPPKVGYYPAQRRPFESVRNAIRFVMEDLPDHQQGDAEIETDGGSIYLFQEIKGVYERHLPNAPQPPLPPLPPDVLSNAGSAKPRRARSRRMRTAVGKSIQRNQTTIVLHAAALLLLLDEKIASLKDERPNETEAIARRDETIALYESLKQQVEAVRVTTVELEHPKGETKATNATASFIRGVRNWWNKKHVEICNKSFDAGLFVSCVGLCSLAGCGGQLAVLVSGVLVAGRPVVEALRALPKKLADD